MLIVPVMDVSVIRLLSELGAINYDRYCDDEDGGKKGHQE